MSQQNQPEGFQNVLGDTLELPCGVILKNRMAKSAMSDCLGDGEGNPTDAQIRLYERWAEGGVALSFIGEVQGIPHFPEKPGNLVLGAHANNDLLQQLTSRATINGAHLWPQLGHAGALAHLPISKPKGPSALDINGLQCTEMTIEEIQELPDLYARTASHAKSVGFSGVHIHAGHGFLLSQFLSPLFNHRNDGYGGSIEARSRIVLEIIVAVRRAVGPTYPVGIRINSTDQLEGGLTENDALELVRLLDQSSIDLIDISGGTYFPGAKASSDGTSRGLYFIDFARKARDVTSVPLMLTGGFKKRDQAVDVVASGAVDMVNLGRAMALNPRLAEAWINEAGGDPEFPKFESVIPGGITAWYTMRLIALGREREQNFMLDLPTAIQKYDKRTELLDAIWKNKFPHF